MNVETSQDISDFFFGRPVSTGGTNICIGNNNFASGAYAWVCQPPRGLFPTTTSDANFGIRRMKAIENYLYLVTSNHEDGFELWRIELSDSAVGEVVFDGGSPDAATPNVDNLSGRGMTVFQNALIIGVENRESGASILRRAINPATGDFAAGSAWSTVAAEGNRANGGSRLNWWYSDFVEFQGTIY